MQEWFCRGYFHHISPLSSPLTAAPQYHLVLTVVLSDVATRIQNAEALFLVITVQLYEGVGWPTSNGQTCHPISKCIRWPHHTVGSTTISPPLPQCMQRNSATSRFFPNLLRVQSLLPNVLLQSPTTGTHICNPWPRRSHRAIPAHHTSSIGRTHKRTSVRNTGPGPPDNGTVLPLQVRRRRADGPMVPCGDHHTGDLS